MKRIELERIYKDYHRDFHDFIVKSNINRSFLQTMVHAAMVEVGIICYHGNIPVGRVNDEDPEFIHWANALYHLHEIVTANM